jgi:hypothetical protein
MTPEDQKSWDYAIRGLTEHLHQVDTLVKMIDINIEITERQFDTTLARIRKVSTHLQMARDHAEILDVINKREIERAEARQTKRLQNAIANKGN